MRLAGVDGLSTASRLCVVTTALLMAVENGEATVPSAGTPGRSRGFLPCVVVPFLALVSDEPAKMRLTGGTREAGGLLEAAVSQLASGMTPSGVDRSGLASAGPCPWPGGTVAGGAEGAPGSGWAPPQESKGRTPWRDPGGAGLVFGFFRARFMRRSWGKARHRVSTHLVNFWRGLLGSCWAVYVFIDRVTPSLNRLLTQRVKENQGGHRPPARTTMTEDVHQLPIG